MLQGDRGYVLCVLKNKQQQQQQKKKAKGRARERKQEQKSGALNCRWAVPGLPWLPKFSGFGTTLNFILNYLCYSITTLKD